MLAALDTCLSHISRTPASQQGGTAGETAAGETGVGGEAAVKAPNFAGCVIEAVDTHAPMKDEGYFVDGVHPNARGADLLARTVAPALSAVLARVQQEAALSPKTTAERKQQEQPAAAADKTAGKTAVGRKLLAEAGQMWTFPPHRFSSQAGAWVPVSPNHQSYEHPILPPVQPERTRSNQPTAKLLTWNVWFDQRDAAQWVEKIGEIISEQNPDIIALQEVTFGRFGSGLVWFGLGAQLGVVFRHPRIPVYLHHCSCAPNKPNQPAKSQVTPWINKLLLAQPWSRGYYATDPAGEHLAGMLCC
jgi:hypothetical protein